MTRDATDADKQALAAAVAAGVTIEDLARAWASMDGKRDEFDEGRGVSVWEDRTGHYAGYCVEAREMIERATRYALDRSGGAGGPE